MFQEIKPLAVNPIFCCNSTTRLISERDTKTHNDPNRDLHEAIFRSFLAFATRRQRAADFMALILGRRLAGPSTPVLDEEGVPMLPPAPAPIFTPELTKNNPLKPHIPYVIHLSARQDFGPVYSHRYFVVPSDLEHDWVEISLLEWFAAGACFKLNAEKWDMKCIKDNTFFRMILRPNLAMRGCYPVAGPQEASGLQMEGQIP